jgi:hypothetical protein
MSSDVWQQSNAALRVFSCLQATDPVPGEPGRRTGTRPVYNSAAPTLQAEGQFPTWETD